MKALRVVVASPGDVQRERDAVAKVVEDLNRGVAADRGLHLQLYRWETDIYPGLHADGPQGLIDPILRIEECDLLIGIFWKRFGTPTAHAQSGTKHELQRGYEAWQRSGRPQIMVYFNQKPYSPQSPAETEQWGRVLRFREEFPKEGLWWSYKGRPQFEELLRRHITNYVRERWSLPPPGDERSGSAPESTPQPTNPDWELSIASGEPGFQPPLRVEQRTRDLMLAAFGDQNLKLADALSQHLAENLDDIRERYRSGRHTTALEELRALRSYPTWDALDHIVRARILRTLAIYELQAETVEAQCKALLEEAHELDPKGDDSAARGVFAYRAGHMDEALRLTEQTRTLPAFNFHCALLLELGCLEQAVTRLQTLPPGIEPDAETLRLQGMAALLQGDAAGARALLEEAYTAQPHWHTVREFRAIADFWGACAPAALDGNNPLVPHPFQLELLRQDDEARARLSRAAEELAQLAAELEGDPQARWRCRFWCFLCVVHTLEAGDQAKESFRELLDLDWGHPLALLWGLAKQVLFDRERAEQALRAVTPENKRYLDQAGLLCALLIEAGKANEALAILDEARARFVQADAQPGWRHWRVHALLATGQVDVAEEEGRNETDAAHRRRLLSVCAYQRFEDSGEWRPWFDFLDHAYRESGVFSYLIEACRLKARAGEWEYIRQHRDVLLARAATAATVYLSAWAAWHGPDSRQCLQLLDDYAGVFPGHTLPEDLQRLRVACLRRLGLLNEAIEFAREHHAKERSWSSLFALLDAQAHQGDYQGVAASARELLSLAGGEADRRFAETVEKLLWISARLARALRLPLEQMSRRLSASVYKATHRLVLAARARA